MWTGISGFIFSASVLPQLRNRGKPSISVQGMDRSHCSRKLGLEQGLGTCLVCGQNEPAVNRLGLAFGPGVRASDYTVDKT